MLWARAANRADAARSFYAAIGLSLLLAAAAGGALIAAPQQSGLDPTRHVYPATVWMLVLWSVLHLGIGAIMQLYCAARRWAGRMNAEHDIDVVNASLYWHFALLTIVITALIVGGFPQVS